MLTRIKGERLQGVIHVVVPPKGTPQRKLIDSFFEFEVREGDTVDLCVDCGFYGGVTEETAEQLALAYTQLLRERLGLDGLER